MWMEFEPTESVCCSRGGCSGLGDKVSMGCTAPSGTFPSLPSSRRRLPACTKGAGALPGGNLDEVIVGILLGELQGFQHVAKLSVVPLVNVIADDGQAPPHQAPGTAQGKNGITTDRPGFLVRPEAGL